MSTKKKNKEQEIPKWFKGYIYPEGCKVRNPFSGETYELNALELSLYDYIMGSQMVNFGNGDDFNKALTWFRVNNPEAYMVLLD